MNDERRHRCPSSEEVVAGAAPLLAAGGAGSRTWSSGPQRAVLLGEALAVFLTESGEPAVVADRCAHRGASLSMGEVDGRGDPVPLPRLGVGRAATAPALRIPSLADQSQIPPRARIAAFPAREQWGLVWTVLEEPLGEPPDAAVVRRRALELGPRRRRSSCRSGSG